MARDTGASGGRIDQIMPEERHSEADDLVPGTPAWWNARYRSNETPWNTGVVPPEVAALIHPERTDRGWALDLGCGTGVSSRYLAAHGYTVLGLDLALSALSAAQRAAETEGVPARFVLADVANLDIVNVPVSLALDIGCFHALPAADRERYVRSLSRRLVPGALYLLYAFEAAPAVGERAGVGPGDMARFAPFFGLCWAQHGWDRDRPAAWYLLRRH